MPSAGPSPRVLGAGLATGSVPAADPGRAAVTLLYQQHALGLIRLAHVMLGDRAAAEDVVQDAFCNLYRRWGKLRDPDKALAYARSSVLNGCRTVLRHGRDRRLGLPGLPEASAGEVASAEAAVLSQEERAAIVTAVRGLPARQREVLVLRYYLDLPEKQIAADLGIGPSTVRSTVHRALAALGRALEESR